MRALKLSPSVALRLVALCALTLVAFAGCADTPKSAPPSVEEAAAEKANTGIVQSALALDVVQVTPERVSVEVRYERADDKEGPRVMELWLKATDGLTLATSDAGAAISAAAKELHVQDKEEGIRVVVLASTNLNTLDTGSIVTLHFDRKTLEGQSIEVLPRMPVFAPTAANEGLRLPEPVSIDG